ncbi:uncharacterized protein LY79DRAFT_536236 [Colletotrichum navitas]|uniref:Uncharacterized protein n=1 Tax=Colletotrichum navitas TaxID=681940 RepID=A0AAD8QD72_9PEZI|nr:uncharacterized protein LY79DRAFT_536236 [Colletotrichum navitas]KAK1598844.1 hypothetical protein LY79DRAFT_536236 [Colletotrichum navitas]
MQIGSTILRQLSVSDWMILTSRSLSCAPALLALVSNRSLSHSSEQALHLRIITVKQSVPLWVLRP